MMMSNVLVSDQEYLGREIVAAHYTISEEKIKIENEHTGYINVVNDRTLIEFKEFELMFKEVRKLAREQKVKLVNQKKFKEEMAEKYEQYLQQFNDSKELFEEMRSIAFEIESRGLHYGTSDDIVLKELYQVRSKFEKIHLLNTPYSKFKDGFRKLEGIKERLKENEGEIQMLGF